jgi:hypothetical protein
MQRIDKTQVLQGLFHSTEGWRQSFGQIFLQHLPDPENGYEIDFAYQGLAENGLFRRFRTLTKKLETTAVASSFGRYQVGSWFGGTYWRQENLRLELDFIHQTYVVKSASGAVVDHGTFWLQRSELSFFQGAWLRYFGQTLRQWRDALLSSVTNGLSP